MFCCARPAASAVLYDVDEDWPAAAAPELLAKSATKASKPMKGKEGKKTMGFLVLDSTMEAPAVTCRDIIPWSPPASPWVLTAQQKEVQEVTQPDFSDITAWQGEDGLQGCLSALEALALISSHHADEYLAEQQKAAANAELQGAWDCWLNANEVVSSAGCKQQPEARCGWCAQLVLPLVVVLLFVCCIIAASNSSIVSRLVSVVESGRTAAVSMLKSGRTVAVSMIESGRTAAVSMVESGRTAAVSAMESMVESGRTAAVSMVESGRTVAVSMVESGRTVAVSMVESGRTAAVSMIESGRTAAVSVMESGRTAAVSVGKSALSSFHHRL